MRERLRNFERVYEFFLLTQKRMFFKCFNETKFYYFTRLCLQVTRKAKKFFSSAKCVLDL